MSYRLVFRPAVAAGRAKKVLSPWLIAEASISISRCPLGASVGVGTSRTSSSRFQLRIRLSLCFPFGHRWIAMTFREPSQRGH